MTALFIQLVHFDEDGPRIGGQIIAQMTFLNRGDGFAVRARWVGHDNQVGLINLSKTSLRLRRKLSDGVQLIAEKFQSKGCLGIRRENVENAAATTELAWQFHSFRRTIAVFHQPDRQFFQIEGLSTAKLSSCRS